MAETSSYSTGLHPSQRRYPPELPERAVRMVQQAIEESGERFGVITRVARQLGIGTESLRSCPAAAGTAPGRGRQIELRTPGSVVRESDHDPGQHADILTVIAGRHRPMLFEPVDAALHRVPQLVGRWVELGRPAALAAPGPPVGGLIVLLRNGGADAAAAQQRALARQL
jgi:transposase-like protein